MIHAVIMAGGAGTRFWPASRVARPKQLLDLAGGKTMIQSTVERLGDLVPPERVMIVTNQQLVEPIAEQLPRLPKEAIVGEPCKRDTAPCIGLAASLICRQHPDAIMLVMPADHVIRTSEQFQETLQQAANLVEDDPSRIVTIGVQPTYPAETYGYIERSGPLEADGPSPTYSVQQFREKPSAEKAREFVESGRYYWNAGIFVWKAATILNALAKYEPEMYHHINTIAEAAGTDRFHEVLEREFAAIQGKSIDYAVMEHFDNVAVIEAPFEWDDVGNWQSLGRTHGSDDKGNTVVGRHLGLRTHGSIVRTDDEHLVVTIGMDDCIVVHTPDATLVANKHDEESVRKAVDMIKENGWDQYL